MIIDAHVHIILEHGGVQERTDELLHYADRLGISRLIACLGDRLKTQPTAEDLRQDNDYVLAAMAHRPDRMEGFCYASPSHVEASLAEIDRCVRDGPMRGIKLWICRHCDDPRNFPIVERAIELGVPVLQHTFIKATGNYPTESTPLHLAALATRYPQAQFIMAHSGGDWLQGLRIVRHLPNISVDVCGGHPEQGQTELAVELLGARRVIYGSDAGGRSFASQLAKVLSAEIPEADRQLILHGNITRIIGL